MRATLAVACVAALAVGCGADDGGAGDGSDASRGEVLFAERCGSCHGVGEIDPDRVVSAVESPPSGMPENLVDEAEARQIAAYVAENRTPREP